MTLMHLIALGLIAFVMAVISLVLIVGAYLPEGMAVCFLLLAVGFVAHEALVAGRNVESNMNRLADSAGEYVNRLADMPVRHLAFSLYPGEVELLRRKGIAPIQYAGLNTGHDQFGSSRSELISAIESITGRRYPPSAT